MIKDLYLLPLRTAAFSLRTSIKAVRQFAEENEHSSTDAEHLLDFLRTLEEHRKISYAFFERMRANETRPEPLLLSDHEETPLHSTCECHETLGISSLLREEFEMREAGIGPHFLISQAVKQPKLAQFLSSMLHTSDSMLLDIRKEYLCLQNDIKGDGISIENVLELPAAMAVNVLLEQVGCTYAKRQKPENQHEELRAKLLNACRFTLGMKNFAEIVMRCGFEACFISSCHKTTKTYEFGGMLMYCPGCIQQYLEPPIVLDPGEAVTILRDYRTGRIIRGKLWYKANVGFYESEQELEVGDLRCFTVFE